MICILAGAVDALVISDDPSILETNHYFNHLNSLLHSQAAPTPGSEGGGSSSKSNPFGAAKPRELVLQSKGIDPTAVEKRVERKASVARLTGELC
jgi:hypothetical protein